MAGSNPPPPLLPLLLAGLVIGLVQLCAGRTAQLLNLSSLASDCGISQPTAKAWLSVLEASFIAFRLPSYHGNVSKRLIKMPKLHFYDSGLACWLLGIRDVQQLSSHPLRGAIFESWVVSEIVKSRFNRGESNGVYFFRDKSGVEADVLVSGNKGWSVIEVKASQTVSSQLAANAERIAAMLAGTTMKGVPIVIHGGAEDQTRKGVRYAAWKNLHVPW